MPLVYRPRRTKKNETYAGRGCCRCAVVAAAAKTGIGQTDSRPIHYAFCYGGGQPRYLDFLLVSIKQRQCAIPRQSVGVVLISIL